MDFLIKTYIPTLSTFDNFYEFKNKNVMVLNKYVSSRDNEGVVSYLNSFLENKNLNSYDKMFALIFLRVLSLGNTVSLKFNNINLKIDKAELNLNIVLNNLLKNKNYKLNDFVYEDIIIKFKIGNSIFFKTFNDLLLDVIDDIYIENALINFKDLTEVDKKIAILRLKKSIKSLLKKHLTETSPYFNISNLDELSGIRINLYNNSAFYFLKTILTSSLSNFYTKLFHVSHKLNLSYDNFLELTPSETDLLLAIYKSQSTIK